jgi:site-specific recombinase XerD
MPGGGVLTRSADWGLSVSDRFAGVGSRYPGLRRSEASELCYWEIITLRGLLEGKGAKNNPNDTIHLRSEVKRAIEGYLEVLGRELRRRETRPEDPVFASVSIRSFGRRLAPSSIHNLVKARVKRAGIPRRATCHRVRHAGRTAALAADVPLHPVHRHPRHKDLRTRLCFDREREARKNPTLELMLDVKQAPFPSVSSSIDPS